MKDLRDDILSDKILSPLIRCCPKYLIRLILVDALSLLLLVGQCASLFYVFNFLTVLVIGHQKAWHLESFFQKSAFDI